MEHKDTIFPCTIEITDGPEKGQIRLNVEWQDLPLGVCFRIISMKEFDGVTHV